MNYELGIQVLQELAQGTDWYYDFAVQEALLRENMRDERFGPSEQSRRDRARIIDQLNRLSLDHTGVSFNELCLGKRPEGGHQIPQGPKNRISVLFLASNPINAERLRLGQEFREIQERLQLAQLRNHFVLEPRMSVRPEDISQALLDVRPQIVHFAGHGAKTGELCLEDQQGQTHYAQPSALAALFEQFAHDVECVVLNACYSETQATAIAQHIHYVVGMNKGIGDEAAIAFALGFYQALGGGRTIEDAYQLGLAQIRLHNIPEHLTPELIQKNRSIQ